MSDEHLQRFAVKVVELQEKKRVVDEEAMLQVAKELGMTEEELQRAREESRSYKTRAQALRSSGNLDEAIAELETAYAFNPLDVEVLYMLADGLFARSQKKQDALEWSRAKELCLRVIEIAPAHVDAPILLNAINNKDPQKQGDNAVPMAIIIGGAVFIGLAILAMLAFFL